MLLGVTEKNNKFPDFSSYGYQVVNELGRNNQSGRITYKACYLNIEHFVAIKQFAFHTTDWEGLKQIEREIAVLKGLNHPGIPKYLDTFHYEGTVCLVQEYIDAPCLTTTRSYQLKEIEAIALQCLDILVYIQSSTSPIIHRDLKPENILWDERTKTAYLIDFGFARVHGNQSIAISSMALGTYGFMPPEALTNKLNLSSDLYSLGVTLICLLCGISSSRISSYIDDDNQIDAKNLLSNVSLPDNFKDWLQRLVSRKMSFRYQNASLALQSFETGKNQKTFALEKRQTNLATECLENQVSLDPIKYSWHQYTSELELIDFPKNNLIIIKVCSILSLFLLGVPWISVHNSSLFSVAKKIQETYPSVQHKINLNSCYQGIVDATYKSETLIEAESSFDSASSCLGLLKYPIDLSTIEEKIEQLISLKKTLEYANTYHIIDLKEATLEKINNLENSLDVEIEMIKINLSLLATTQDKMNLNLLIYCYGIIGFALIIVLFTGFFLIVLNNKFKEMEPTNNSE